MAKVTIQINLSEALDRLSILELKAARLTGLVQTIALKQFNELKGQLEETCNKPVVTTIVWYTQLLKINERLWEYEDRIRWIRKNGDLDSVLQCDDLRRIAISISEWNDKRYKLKQQIDQECGDNPSEVKGYV